MSTMAESRCLSEISGDAVQDTNLVPPQEPSQIRPKSLNMVAMGAEPQNECWRQQVSPIIELVDEDQLSQERLRSASLVTCRSFPSSPVEVCQLSGPFNFPCALKPCKMSTPSRISNSHPELGTHEMGVAEIAPECTSHNCAEGVPTNTINDDDPDQTEAPIFIVGNMNCPRQTSSQDLDDPPDSINSAELQSFEEIDLNSLGRDGDRSSNGKAPCIVVNTGATDCGDGVGVNLKSPSRSHGDQSSSRQRDQTEAKSSFSSLSSLVSTGTEFSLFSTSVGEEGSIQCFPAECEEAANVTTRSDWSSSPSLNRHSSDQRDVSQDSNIEQKMRQGIAKLSNIFSKRSKSSLSGSSTSLNSLSVVSTTGLILQDRPAGLPAKRPEEMKKHNEEYQKMIDGIKRKELAKTRSHAVATERRLEAEERTQRLLEVWRRQVIPNWETARTGRRVRALWWEGVPSAVRGQVWKLAIGNELRINSHLYEICLQRMRDRMVPRELPVNGIDGGVESAPCEHCSPRNSPRGEVNGPSTCSPVKEKLPYGFGLPDKESSIATIKLDVSRTFPSLSLFQEGGPYHDTLHDLLGAYVCYRPDIGYVQGMSFIAAVLLLTMDVADAFISFANILNQPCHHAFYSMDEFAFTVYFGVFDKLFSVNLPRLHNHFANCHLELNMFLFDWIFTLFSRTLPLEAAFRVWDLYCRDGEAALFRAALGLLRLYEPRLLSSDFDRMAQFLTGPMPETLTPGELLPHVQAVVMRVEKKDFDQLVTAVSCEMGGADVDWEAV